MDTIKQDLYNECQQYLEGGIQTLQQAINSARAAASEETKSSAGDKYETTRAMMQLEIEKNAGQLANLQKLRQVLHRIDPAVTSTKVQLGSLVITDAGNYYIAVSAGKITIGDTLYYAISAVSPLGSKLMDLSAGEVARLDKRTFTIQAVK